MVNDGSGGFRIERGRATDAVFRNSLYGYWQHVGHSFVDADGDGDPDLALGRIDGGRDVPSIVAVNDGTGHYPTRIVLPDLTFNEGWTAVQALARFDVNSDGLDWYTSATALQSALVHGPLHPGPAQRRRYGVRG